MVFSRSVDELWDDWIQEAVPGAGRRHSAGYEGRAEAGIRTAPFLLIRLAFPGHARGTWDPELFVPEFD
jgi:hypothetical protein